MHINIKVGSITNAQRGYNELKKHAYSVSIRKSEDPSPKEGCGYILRVQCTSDEPIKILEQNNVKILGVEHF